VLREIHSLAELRALPDEALPALCEELRSEIIAICGKVGGHLGASLGAVELIVALHRVFKAPTDAIVFDVGHQAYAHKILTGRFDRMQTLRQSEGVAPFLDPTESKYDAFGAGHACTAVSVALGVLHAKRLGREPGCAIAVIGDGALTGGLTFEGLNNAGASTEPLIILLNDNQMSISVNVGGVPRMLRSPLARAFFESLGFTYLGPIDGHDLRALANGLKECRRSHKPIILHALTEKGRGFGPAEADERTRGHAMGPYELRDGKLVRARPGQLTFSEAFAAALEERMARDPRVVAVTPAMLEGSALMAVRDRFPDRVFDVGIAEQHAVAFSAGLAARGMRPVCCIYSTFLQRAYDQVIHDVCLPGLPVLFAIDRAGLVGADGATHQGAYDIAFLRPLPSLTMMVPVGGEDLGPMIDTALASNGPTALRFPRATLPTLPPQFRPPSAPIEGARWLKRAQSPRLAIVAIGPLVVAALEAAGAAADWSVLDARFILPLDREALTEAAAAGSVLTVEEGSVRGGFGSSVEELFSEQGLRVKLSTLGLPPRFVRHGDAKRQRIELGLDAAGIRRAALQLLES
jgi:1-deoxy-D-xylulose-5-phosphate synthase